tara:strand:- start:1870 stop:3426 length:1557 start_codon:yes stop_codon:yes gene_type:complete
LILEALNFVLYFLISIIYFYSTLGFGKFLSNQNSNFFDYQFEGTIFLLVIGYFLYLSIGINVILNLAIIVTGIVLFILNKQKKTTVELKYIFLLFFLIFSVLIISKTHEDFNTYHYFSIFEVFNNNLRIGVSLLNERFFHSSNLIFNQALIILPYFEFQIVHLPVFIIYLSTIGYFVFVIFSKTSKSHELFFSLLCVLILLVKFNRLSEYGYDYIAQFILLIVFHKIYFLSLNKSEIIKSITYFIFSILIKPISLLFLPIFFFILYKKDVTFIKKLPHTKYFIIVLLFSILLSSSFFRTGCIFYPLNSTCFSKDKIFWSEKERIKQYSQEVSLWAKGYYVQNESKYKKIDDKKLFNKNLNWIKFWVEKHFFYKIYEFILLLIASIFLIYIYCNKKNYNYKIHKKEKIIVLGLSLISIIFWINTVPQFRFGFSAIIIFLFFFLSLFLNLNIKFNKKKFTHILIFGLLILNFKNLNRIDDEFKRNDFYKFINFPYFNEITIKNDYSKLKKENFFHIELLK